MRYSLVKSCGVFFFAILLSPFLPLSLAYGADLHVSTDGQDYSASDGKSLTKSNDCGDSATPCGSITHATSLAKSGDTIRVGEGTFSKDEAFPIYIRAGVILQGAGDGLTVIEGSDVEALVVVAPSGDKTGETSSRVIGVKIRGNKKGAGIKFSSHPADGDRSKDHAMKNSIVKPTGADEPTKAFTIGYGYGFFNSSGVVSKATIIGNTIGVIAGADWGTYNIALNKNVIVSNMVGVVAYANTTTLFISSGTFTTYTFPPNYNTNPTTSTSPYYTITTTTPTSTYWITTYFFSSTYVGKVNMAMDSNLVSNNSSLGVLLSEQYYGYSGSSVNLNAKNNTFNNPTNIVKVSGNETATTTNNWWPGGSDTAYPSPNSNPLICADITVPSTGGTVTISAGDASTFFIDGIGSSNIRMTLDIAGTPATIGAVSGPGNSFTATVPAMTPGTYTATATNATGQACAFNITYTSSAITITVVVTDGRGGRTTKTLKLTPQ